MNWYIEVLKKYAVFSGRARRKEFWFFVLFNFLFSVLFSFIGAVTFTGPLLEGLYSLAIAIPYLAVTVRRLHDTNRSGWWMLMPTLVFILLGIVAALFMPMLVVDNASASAGTIVFGGIAMLGILAAFIVFIVFLASYGTPGVNRYGPDPKQSIEPVFNIQDPLRQFRDSNNKPQQSQYGTHVDRKTQVTHVQSVTLLGVGHRTLPIIISVNREIVVGRSPNANVVIENQFVSGQHLSLTLNENNEVIVVDLGSSNGTYIQGVKLSPNKRYVLHQNEHLVIGSEDIMYTL